MLTLVKCSSRHSLTIGDNEASKLPRRRLSGMRLSMYTKLIYCTVREEYLILYKPVAWLLILQSFYLKDMQKRGVKRGKREEKKNSFGVRYFGY